MWSTLVPRNKAALSVGVSPSELASRLNSFEKMQNKMRWRGKSRSCFLIWITNTRNCLFHSFSFPLKSCGKTPPFVGSVRICLRCSAFKAVSQRADAGGSYPSRRQQEAEMWLCRLPVLMEALTSVSQHCGEDRGGHVSLIFPPRSVPL